MENDDVVTASDTNGYKDKGWSILYTVIPREIGLLLATRIIT